MKREESHWCDGASSATRQGRFVVVMWSGRGSKGMILESKKGPKEVPKCAQIKKATKVKCKTYIKAKKNRELKERCSATPVCTGNVYFGHNSRLVAD